MNVRIRGTRSPDGGKIAHIQSQVMPSLSLPLFPLDLVLFPDEIIPLHIFEDRYKTLVSDCLQQDIPFGIVRQQNGILQKMGCTVRIREVLTTHEDGRQDIMVEGEERFRVLEIVRELLYQTADVEVLADTKEPVDADERERLIAQHIKLLELAGRTPSPSAYENRARLSYFVGRNAGLSMGQRQMLLEMRSEQQRILFLVTHLNQFIPAVKKAEKFRVKISSNGHFPDFPPS